MDPRFQSTYTTGGQYTGARLTPGYPAQGGFGQSPSLAPTLGVPTPGVRMERRSNIETTSNSFNIDKNSLYSGRQMGSGTPSGAPYTVVRSAQDLGSGQRLERGSQRIGLSNYGDNSLLTKPSLTPATGTQYGQSANSGGRPGEYTITLSIPPQSPRVERTSLENTESAGQTRPERTSYHNTSQPTAQASRPTPMSAGPKRNPNLRGRPGKPIIKRNNSRSGYKKNISFDQNPRVVAFDPYIVRNVQVVSRGPSGGGAFTPLGGTLGVPQGPRPERLSERGTTFNQAPSLGIPQGGRVQRISERY